MIQLGPDAKVEMRQRSLRRVFHFRGLLLGRIQGDREPVSFFVNFTGYFLF